MIRKLQNLALFVVWCFLLVVVFSQCAKAMDLPDPFMVAVKTQHSLITLDGTTHSWTTHDLVPMSHALWVSKHGPITDLDLKEEWGSGCLRLIFVLHHCDI